MEVRVRSQVRRGRPIPVSFTSARNRCVQAAAPGSAFLLTYVLTGWDVDGHAWPLPPPPPAPAEVRYPRPWVPDRAGPIEPYEMLALYSESAPTRHLIDLPPHLRDALPLGPHGLNLRFEVTIRESAREATWAWRPPFDRRSYEVSLPWELVAEHAQTVTLVRPDPGTAARLAGAISLVPPFFESDARLSISADGPPIAVAAGAYTRGRDGRITGGDVAVAFAAGCRWSDEGPPYRDPPDVEVILRPNPDVAERTAEITRIWGEAIVLKVPPRPGAAAVAAPAATGIDPVAPLGAGDRP
jgi:hypothetical protein